MTPSRFQVPPPASPSVSHSVSGEPPANGTFLSFLPAKNAMYWPSGDQNGASASSVPSIDVARNESSGRIQSIRFLSVLNAENASIRPSGEMAGGQAQKGRWGARAANINI